VDTRRLGYLLATSSVSALLYGTGPAAASGCAVSQNSGSAGSLSNSGAINCISVTGGASITGNVTNTPSGTLTAGAGATKTGILVNTATIGGSIINAGKINAPSGNGIFVTNAPVAGGISNSGTISANIAKAGINVNVGSSFGGGLTNSGIVAGGTGIAAFNISTFTGGLTNSGTINSTNSTRAGINTGSTSTFSGGILNTGSILTTGIHGIDVDNVSNFSGGITNAGVISVSSFNGILVGLTTTRSGRTSTFSGGITNSGSINASRTGILAAPSTFLGGITNSGTISMRLSGLGAGVLVGFSSANAVSLFAGGVTNTGMIAGFGDGIQLAYTSSFSGGITNAGTMSVAGRGIEVQFVSNFSGGILNTGSIFSASRPAALPGSIGLSSLRALNIANTSTFAGGVTNIGSLSGTSRGLNISTVSTFAGGITNSGSISGGQFGLDVNAVSNFSGGITNSGVIAGAGAAGIILGGTTAGAGNSTFSGGISNTGTISGALGIVANQTPSVSVFDSGVITGTGGTAIKFASGGTNTLTLGPGYSITGNVLGAGSDNLFLGGTGAGTFALGGVGTQYTGFGTFGVTGATWNLTGTDTGFTGNNIVTGGNMVVGTAASPNTVLVGSVTVGGGGTLSGHGSITGSVTNTSGIVAPGGSIGTLTVGGNYSQGSSGSLVIQVMPSGASQLAVGGAASLSGTLLAQPTGTFTPFSKFEILMATGGVSGTFSTVTSTGLPVTALYFPTFVDIEVGGFVGQTRNQVAVANNLNNAFGNATGDFSTVLIAAANEPLSQQPQTLASLGGQIYANMAEVSLADRRLFLGAMDERLRLGAGGSPGAAVLGGLVPGSFGGGANAMQFAMLGSAISDRTTGAGDPMNPLTETQLAQAAAPAAGPWMPGMPDNLWARGFGQVGHLDNNGGALGGDYSTGGGAVGADLIHTPQSILGIAAGGGQSTLSTSSLPESGTVSFVELGVYGAQAYNYGLVADGALEYAHDYYDVTRGIVGLGRTASSSHGGDDAVIDVGISRPMQYDAWTVTPRVGLSYFHIGQDGFSETGANSLDLTVAPDALDALRTRLGATVSQPMVWGGWQFQPEFRAAWTHDFLDDRGNTLAAFAGAPGVVFQQIGASSGRDAADLGVGVSWAIAQTTVPGQLSAFFQYDASLAAHQTNNAFAGGLKLTW